MILLSVKFYNVILVST